MRKPQVALWGAFGQSPPKSAALVVAAIMWAFLLALPLLGCRPAPPTATATPEPAATAAAQPSPVATEPLPTPEATPTPQVAPLPAAPEVPPPPGGPTPEWRRAVELFKEAYRLQLQGRLQEAAGVYQRSIATFPTAEAYTFLAWTYSWMGRYDLAIAEALKAVQLDPDYGNPYNDLGAYYLLLGRPDDAIPWLERALQAPRYATPHFPWLNLGRAWVQKQSWDKAMEAFEGALTMASELQLPELPVLTITLPSDSQPPLPPPDDPRSLAVRKALDDYVTAWNGYSPGALVAASAFAEPEALGVLLMHLARAKLTGARLELSDVELIYLEEAGTVVKAQLKEGDKTATVHYILTLKDRTWKVLSRAIPWAPSGLG